MPTDMTLSPKKGLSKKLLACLLISLVVILIGTSGYFYYRYRKLSQNPVLGAQITAQEEAQKLATDIGKLMLLPKDEVPTVATVTDIDKLKDQPFFKNATNGNKVLIYPNSKLAIIYDPNARLIVSVGPVNFQADETQQVLKTRVGLRNGTDIQGLTDKVETDIINTFPDVNIAVKDQSNRTDYEQTIVIMLNETVKDPASELAKNLNATVNDMPEGEATPQNLDILIIIGRDRS